jgi:hypothetical protein
LGKAPRIGDIPKKKGAKIMMYVIKLGLAFQECSQPIQPYPILKHIVNVMMSINIGKSQGSTNVSHLVPLVGRCKTKVLEDVLFPNIHKDDSEYIREFL